MSQPKLKWDRRKIYELTDKGTVWWRPSDEGASPTYLANFTGQIIASYLLDDGSEGIPERVLKIQCTLNNKKSVVVSVPVRKFTAMEWPLEMLGPRAQVGVNARDRLRAAILNCSPPASLEEHCIYSHTGWREIDGQNVYMHAGGAIGPKGALKIETQVSHVLNKFELPDPRKKPEIIRAVRASMKMLEIAPDRVTFALFAAVWRAILGNASFSLHLTGRTGAGKSVLAALAQQHYGPKMDGDHLPGSWTSSINANEALAFEAKDALYVIDDFNPIGSATDVQRWHKDADRLFRSQGNQAGRARMRVDTTIRAPKFPRGVILSTGEETPNGQSLKARLLIIEIAKGELNFKKLTDCQTDAAAGLYAMALSGFIRWLAPRITNAEKQMQKAISEYRHAAQKIGDQSHMRTPDNVANLMQGFHFWLSFATSIKAITKEKRAQLWQRACVAFDELIRVQTSNQTTADPTGQFISMLLSALTGGRAHLVDSAGGVPHRNPAEFGWRKEEQRNGTTWTAQGQKIGWIRNDDVYLEPTNAFAAVQAIARDTGQHITLTVSTLQRRLKQANLLASFDEAHETTTIRRILEGAKHSVLHFSYVSLYPSGKPVKPDISTFVGKSAWTDEGLETDKLTEKPDKPTFTRHRQAPKTKDDTGKMSGLSDSPTPYRGKGPQLVRKRKTAMSGRQKKPVKMSGKNPTFRQTAEYVQSLYPTTGPEFITQLAEHCRVFVADISDTELCRITRAAFAEKKKVQHSAGLFLTTVPLLAARLKEERKADAERERRQIANNDAAEKSAAYMDFVSNAVDHFLENANGNAQLAEIRKRSLAAAKKQYPNMSREQQERIADQSTRRDVRESDLVKVPKFEQWIKSAKAETA